MNTEIVEALIPGVQPWGVIFVGLAFVLLGILISSFLDWDDDGFWSGMGILLFAIWALGCTIILVSGNANNWDKARETALNKAGYTQVEMHTLNFTAVHEGDRVKGILEEIRQDETTTFYQVIIIPPIP